MELADSFDTKTSEEEKFFLINSSDHRSEDSLARVTIEELLAVVDTTITTTGDENVFGKINESNPADLTSHCKSALISLKNSATQHLADRDEMIALNQDINNTPPENLNENRVENFEVSKTYLEKAYELQDCSQTEKLNSDDDPLQHDYDPFENFGVNQSPILDNCGVDKLVINHIRESNETLGEVYSIPEVSNVTDIETLLKSHQEEFSESSKNLSRDLEEESNDMQENNDVENSSCNLITHCELETETNGDIHNPCSPVFSNSCSSFAESDICKSDFKIDSLSLVKSCFVDLQRCDSLVKEYFTSMEHPTCCPASLLEMDALSNISNTEKVNESISKDLKLKTRERNLIKSTTTSYSDIDDAEPHEETSNIKKAKRKEEHLNFTDYDDSEIFFGNKTNKMKCNVNKKDENVMEGGTTGSDLSVSDASDIVDVTQDTLNTNNKSKKRPKNKSPLQNDNLESDIDDTAISKKSKVKGYLNIINKYSCRNKVIVKKKDINQTKEILEHSIAQMPNTSNFESYEENFKINKKRKKLKNGIRNQKKRKSDLRDTLEIKDATKTSNKNVKTNEGCTKNDNRLHFNISETSEKNLPTNKYRSKMLIDHDQQLNKSDDSEIDSDCNTSRENFKTHECMKSKDVFETLNTQTSVSIKRTEHKLNNLKFQSHKKSMFVEQKEKNKANADKEHKNELSDASSCSLIGSILDQPEVQLDYSLLTKPCHVVLTRCDYINNEKTSSHCSLLSDWSEHSDLDHEDLKDCNEKKIDKTPKLFSVSDQYEDSRNELVKTAKERKVKRRISDLNEMRSMESAIILLDTSDTEIHLSTNGSSEQFRKKSKHKKYQSQAEAYAPDPSTSKGSGVNKELLELSKNELTHELKELKTIMKRTERKMDLLIKLHEQVLDCYV